MSRLHARRLADARHPGPVTLLPGLYAGHARTSSAERVDPDLVVYAGRFVREKRVDALVRGFAAAHARRPGLRLELYGDGPERPRIEALAREIGLEGAVVVRGRSPEQEVASAMARAACVATASEREGYGLVVVEAAAEGTPSVVVAGPENAAVELVDPGANGAVARSASADDVARALLDVVEAGDRLRETTTAWFAGNVDRLTIDRSLELVLEEYACLGREGVRPSSEAR
jgi:glycosyltransferase involved in cell wall biosynthesis